MNIGQFVAAEIIILLVINSVEKLVTGLESFYDVLTSLEKIGQVVDKELESQDGTNPFKSNKEATISLDNVSYVGGTGDTILQNLNLELNPKDRVFIDGPSGSGKTTLLKLLSGIIEPTSGSIYVNDFNIKGMHMNTYRSQIGQVLPEQMPFEGSILENITLGNTNITIDKVNQTIRDVGLLEFVRKQPRGIEDFIFSEGQKIPHTVSKRLLIARAIVHNPKILILKDALEHFEDHEAQELIQFLSDPNRDWLLIVSGKHTDWEDVCNKQLSLHKVNTSS